MYEWGMFWVWHVLQKHSYFKPMHEKALQPLYFVSSQERPWRHWARPRIHAARRILYASISVFLFERVRKHTKYARGCKRLPLKYALTSRSFLRWDKVYTSIEMCALINHYWNTFREIWKYNQSSNGTKQLILILYMYY